MKKIAALTAVISMTIFMLFSVSGCFNPGQKVADEDGEAEVNISEEGVSIKADEGEMIIGEGVDLPDDFPKVVPVYPDMKIVTSWKSTADGKDTFSISASTSDPGSTVFDWYKSELKGWENEGEFTSESGGESTFNIYANNGTYSIAVIIVESDEETIVALAASEI
ncbi:MAG: hypothetical protein HQ569_09890 [Actinobacteria bacterium]|nr:hypothetical protein [Actinomycetota bacterium]